MRVGSAGAGRSRRLWARSGPHGPPEVAVDRLRVWYGQELVLRDISLTVPAGQMLAAVGPSGCGKTTLLRALNRLHDLDPGTRVEGRVRVGGQDIYAPGVDPVTVRRRVGMLMQRPVALPGSILENVTFAPRLWGIRDPDRLRVLAEEALRQAGLWHEVRHRLGAAATALSGGQLQRLCLARALALRPEVLLLDEPTSALDAYAAAGLERLLEDLKGAITLVLVSHDLEQVRRLADRTALLLGGELVECAPTGVFFDSPADPRTRRFLSWGAERSHL